MARIEVPRSISEAPTDRLYTSVLIDQQLRQITGARAPTVGQGTGDAAAREPSAYLMGDQSAANNQQTTIQIVMRALVGTQVFDFLDEKARAKTSIDLDFRTFGPIRNRFPLKTEFIISAAGTAGGTKGLSLLAGPGLYMGTDAEKHTVREGGVLEVVDGPLTKEDYTVAVPLEGSAGSDYLPSVSTGINPRFLVLSDVLYDVAGENPQPYVKGRSGIALWPSKGDSSTTVLDEAALLLKVQVVHRDQSVHWTAKGTVGGFNPGLGEDSLLYTLDVTLSEAMARTVIIHSSEAHLGKPHYS